MSYGTVWADARRQVGIYGGKILKGAMPADLPVQQSVKVEFVLNLKTAKTLGLYEGLTWWFVRERIGHGLRESYRVPEELPPKLLALVRSGSWQNDVDLFGD
jgi:hypothetical protein